MQDLLDLIRQHGGFVYALLFAYCAFKSGALPLLAGYAAKSGALDLSAVFVVVLAGAYLGDEARFAVARRLGPALRSRNGRLKPALDVATRLLDRHGALYVFAYRYPKGLRTVGALPVGLTTMSWRRFTLLNLGSASVWAMLLVGAGYGLGHLIADGAGPWGSGIGFALLIVFGLFTILAWREVNKELRQASALS
jgi:membrane protein DedA with SNARE-associated domain